MGRTAFSWWMVAAWSGATIALVGCGASDSGGNKNATITGSGGATLAQGGATGGSKATGVSGTQALPMTGGKSGGAGMLADMTGGTSGGGVAGSGGTTGSGGATGSGGTSSTPTTPFNGPLDGDETKPMVEAMGVPCGAPAVGFGGPPAANMVKITNRDVFVAYPCAHEGAAVTFYLAIHGTLQEGQKIPFTLSNFPVHTKVDSDNFIVVAPQAIGTQWGREDGGADLPHLYDVVNWVYDTFGEKFKIRGMWASGGSWGSFYLGTFACDPMLENRLTGVRMIVGLGCPSCSSRLSCIVGEQELEEGGGMALTEDQKQMHVMGADVEKYATMHGCDAVTGPTNIGPVRAWTWPNCDAGWAHSYYLAPGNHADRWDDPAYVDHMVAEMKATDR